ncbi:MAG: glycosyltransferase family 1 protein, partial [Acidimicrobiales bacterium]
VPPADPAALAAALGRVLDDPALGSRLGAAGRDRVLSAFTWRATALGTVEQYRVLLEAPGAPGHGAGPAGSAGAGTDGAARGQTAPC